MTEAVCRPPGAKICIGCDELLSVDRFYSRHQNDRKIYSSRCKTCFKKQRSERHHADRQRYHKYLQDKSCVDCGLDDPIVLTHDHLDPSNKFMKVSQMIGNYSWKRIMAEISKCDVVCANCHAKRTAKQQGWYQ